MDSRDVDRRHVFLATSRDKNRCHLCLKDKSDSDHVSEDVYARISKARYAMDIMDAAWLTDEEFRTLWEYFVNRTALDLEI